MKRQLQSIYWRGILLTLVMAVASIGVMVKMKIDDTRNNLNAVLHAASLWTLESNADLQQLADSIASVSPPIRVTFLMDTGLILADSQKGADRTGDHYADPEIVSARRGEIGRDFRLSATSTTFVLYMARRLSPQLILRVSYPVLGTARLLAAYGCGLLVLFLALYMLQRRSIVAFTKKQVRQMEDILSLLDGESAEIQAVFPEFQSALNAIAYRVERLKTDQREIMRTLNLRNDFVANASHELRSPLTSVRGYAEMLKEGWASSPEEASLCLRTILSECDRMLAVIEDILLLSKAERPMEVPPEKIDVLPVALEVCASLAQRAKQKNIALSAEGALMLAIDEKSIWEILYNLVDNAVRYGRNDGYVRIRMTENQIQVEDNGIGIAAAHLPRVFEQFYRVDDTRGTPEGGTGLGLSIVKALAERYGGTIQAESELGKGSRFTIRFSREVP